MTSENPSEQEHPAPNAGDKTKHNSSETNPIVSPAPRATETKSEPSRQSGCQSCDKQKHWLDYLEAEMAAIGLLVLIAYTIFSCLQWLQIRWTNRLTREALDGSNASLQQTIGKMQEQINQMTRLADNAGRQADRTQDLANRGRDQALATRQSANAATSAASTAKETLHISERAYVTEGNVRIDLDNHIIVVPITNSGHIPSGETGITVHHAIGNGTDPLRPNQWLVSADCGWKHQRVESVAVGTPYEITIPISNADKNKVNDGTQQIFVAGFIEYNDGFSDTPPRDWPFCFATYYQSVTKKTIVGPYDPALYIRYLERCDKYPRNEDQ
jgi:hypothetical protein